MNTNLMAVARVMLVATIGLGVAHAQANDQATQAAESWVGFVDGAHYGESWEAAASAFKRAVPQQTWIGAVQTVRAPLGPVTSRTVKSRTATTSLPGAPDGEYVVLQFNAVFEHKAAALETITVIHEPDGSWRVVGYFVR